MQEGEGVFWGKIREGRRIRETGEEAGGLGSLRLLSPMHGRYYGEKTQAGCFGEKTQAGKSGEREQADTGARGNSREG